MDPLKKQQIDWVKAVMAYLGLKSANQLAELIEAISSQARQEAENATVVAQNIQHIFAVTEQTGEGTRSTAQMVRELSRTAEELKQSVARFKIE